MQISVSFLGLLGLLFIGLKLGGIISWSWWIVLLPLYVMPLIALVSVALVGLIGLIVMLWQ